MPVVGCTLKYLKIDLIIHSKWTPSVPIRWLLSCISLLLFIALMVAKKKKNFICFLHFKRNAFHSIPQSGAFKSETERVHITPREATKGGWSGQGVPRQCSEANGLFQRAEQSKGRGGGVGEECQHLAFAGSCHKVNKGLGRMMAP